MHTNQQAADLQSAIKKTLHSAAFGKFMAQAVQAAVESLEPASTAVVLAAKPLKHFDFYESNLYSSYAVVSEDESCVISMQCERAPADPKWKGVWYGSEKRTDSDGRVWSRQLPHMVQDDFGMLVERPA